MASFAEPVRRRVADGLGFGDVAGRLARFITHAIDREQADALLEHQAGAQRLPLESRLRIATFFALGCGVLFLPVDGTPVPSHVLASLLLLYGFHAVLTTVVLIASFTAWGERRADALALFLVVGHALDLHVYVYLWPTYPGLAAGILTCLLVGSSVLFSWSTGRMLVLSTVFCAAFMLVGIAAIPRDVQRPDFAVSTTMLLVGAATAVGCTRLLALLRASLAQRQRELRELSARLMSVQEEERRRLARDLHDEFGQSLTAVNAYLWLIERQLPEELADPRRHMAEARRVLAATLAAMRELSQLLRPAVLDTFGLETSLKSLLEAFGERHQIAASLVVDGVPERLPPEMETALFRIGQEALTNVARHAQARRVRVAVSTMGAELRFEIEDDGIGMSPPSGGVPAGTGLIGIRERVHALGGQLAITSPNGTCLSVRVPLPR